MDDDAASDEDADDVVNADDDSNDDAANGDDAYGDDIYASDDDVNEACSQYLISFLEGTTDAKDTCEGIMNAYTAAGKRQCLRMKVICTVCCLFSSFRSHLYLLSSSAPRLLVQ